MNTRGFPGRAGRKLLLVTLLVVLALQGFGTNGLAASSRYLQEGEQLICGCPQTSIQTVFLIDDSGSMRSNDRTSERNKMAKDFINLLASLQEASGSTVQNVKVAVIHFTGNVQTNSGDSQVDLTPKFWDLKASTAGKLFDIIDWRPTYDRPETTNFLPPFEQTKNLFADPELAQTDCARRSIVLLTDGTPEDLQGIITDANSLAALKQNIESTAKGQLDRLIVIGYKVNGTYFTKDMEEYWRGIVQSVSSSGEVPDVVLLSPEAAKAVIANAQAVVETAQEESPTRAQEEEIAKRIEAVKAYLGKKVDNPTGLQNYQNMTLSLDPVTPTVKPGVENIIKFKLLDGAGKPVVPDDIISPYSLNLTSSIIQGSEEQTIQQSGPDGDSYQVSWTPDRFKDGQLNVKVNFVNGDKEVLSCSTSVDLITEDFPPPNGQTIVLSLVVGSPRLPVKDGSVTFPLYLDYKGHKAQASSLIWRSTATDLDKRDQILNASVTPNSKAPGEYELTISGLREANPEETIRIQAQVSADTVLDDQPITVDAAPTTFEYTKPFLQGCDCSTGLWGIWFWPMIILLAGLLILLLAYRFLRVREGENAQSRGWMIRRGDWHFLFWPLLVVFILMILVRVFEWCCQIPFWLFVALFMVWLVMLVLVSFTPESDPRPRPWWLVLLLLLLVPIFFFVFPSLWPFLIMLDLLALAWLQIWWRPLPPAPVGISLSLGSPPLPPVDDSLTIPIRLRFRGNRKSPSALNWNCFVTSSSPLAGWKITPEAADRNEYELILEGIGTASTIDVELTADVEVDDQRLTTPQASTRINLSRRLPAFNLAIGDCDEFQNGSVTIPLEVNLEGRDEADPSVQWDVQEWHVIGMPSGKDLSNEVVRGEKRGSGSLAISGISSALANTTRVQVSADVKVDGQVVKTPQATATVHVIPVPIPVPLPEYRQITLNVELPTPCWPFGETVIVHGNLEYKGKERITSATWNPNVRVLPAGPVVGARIESFDEESGEFVLIVDPVIITPETFDKDHPPAEIQVQICADAVLGNGLPLEVIGKTATIALCKDDLTELEGIGPVYGTLLNKHNVFNFRQLAMTEVTDLTSWLNKDGYQREDPKTWPQQAELADIARHYKDQEDNYKAYKAWLDRGSEPDERDKEEDERRKEALSWNRIAEFTPVVLRKVFNASQTLEEPLTFPIQLNRGEDEIRLIDVEWKVNASVLPGENGKAENVQASVGPVDPAQGTYELVIHPLPDRSAREIQVMVQALRNGRSIEVYKGKAITVHINPPALPPDNLEDLEGIGPVYRGILNNSGIFTFSQLAGKTVQEITKILNDSGYEREDPKTWPQQAKLASIAKYGMETEKRSYEAYKAWLHRGVEPDEVDVPEKNRRKEALVWHGTAEATEAEAKNNPDIEFPNRHARE